MRDLISNIKLTSGLDAEVKAADTDCADLDMQGYRSVVILANIGTEGITLDGSNYIEFVIQHADDDGSGSPDTYADVTDNNIILGGTVDSAGAFALVNAAADDNATYSIGYVGIKRWVRAQVEFTGTHGTGTPVCVQYIQGNAAKLPTS